jgi:prephenate dehydratase
VAFQGEHGAFSEDAAMHFFSGKVNTIPSPSFEDVFQHVQNGKTRFGIIPIENTLVGSIHQNYDLLSLYNLFIIGEIKLRIVHALLARHGARLRDVRSVYSHPQALGQCDRFLRKLKRIQAVAVYDTAGAAKMVKEQSRNDIAAIASVGAAQFYKLQVIRKGIENNHQNFTRFLILAKQKITPQRRAKTSILVSLKNEPGALFRAVSVFALRNIDLYKIESRPLVGKPWEYLFYIDFEGTMSELKSLQAVRHLRETALRVKILGSYTHGKTAGVKSS